MTRRLPILLALALALVAGIAHAQDQRYVQRRATLAHALDLEALAADDDRVVAAAALADSTTYVLAAIPDSCRPVDITVTDADSSISAGTITVTGVDCLNYARVCRFTFASGGSGVKTLSVVSGSGTSCYLSNVTSVVTSALTGEGAGDEVKVGYTTNAPLTWAVLGKLMDPGPNGEHGVDPFGSTAVALPITTSGTSSTTVTSVATNAAFTDVAVGDMLVIALASGQVYERRVTARASADSITVHQAITIPAAGVPFSYRRRYLSSDPTDIMAVPVGGWKSATFTWAVEANAATGGVVTQLACTRQDPNWPTPNWVTQPQPITTIASGATTVDAAGLYSAISESIDVESTGYTHCKQGFRFGTGDDLDAGGADKIHLGVSLVR
jgi:hypothetical protein